MNQRGDMSTTRTASTIGALILLMPAAASPQRTPVRTAVRPAAVAPQGQGAMKGIWEPVNYGEDIELTGVYFVTADEGWVSGGTIEHGVLLHTTDAGDHWEVAVGDPAGSQAGFRDLRFVDQVTGFAVQRTGVGDHTLLRTTDGKRWTVSGTVPQHRADYAFVSANVGVAATGYEIRRTTDGGRTW